MLQSAIKVCFSKAQFSGTLTPKAQRKASQREAKHLASSTPIYIVWPLSASNQKLYPADMFRKHSPGLRFILAIYLMHQKDKTLTITKTNIYITFYMIIQVHFKSLCMLIESSRHFNQVYLLSSHFSDEKTKTVRFTLKSGFGIWIQMLQLQRLCS